MARRDYAIIQAADLQHRLRASWHRSFCSFNLHHILFLNALSYSKSKILLLEVSLNYTYTSEVFYLCSDIGVLQALTSPRSRMCFLLAANLTLSRNLLLLPPNRHSTKSGVPSYLDDDRVLKVPNVEFRWRWWPSKLYSWYSSFKIQSSLGAYSRTRTALSHIFLQKQY